MHNLDTVLLLIPPSPMACTRSSTRRVDTPPIQAVDQCPCVTPMKHARSMVYRADRRRDTSPIHMRIKPAYELCDALGCGCSYAEATPVTGTAVDVTGFLVAAEDLLAEFLADVVVSPVASRFLPGLPPGDVA